MNREWKQKEQYPLTHNCNLHLEVQCYRDKDSSIEELDTYVSMEGRFAVEGGRRKEFAMKLQDLVDEYSI